jgi:amino acid transporter
VLTFAAVAWILANQASLLQNVSLSAVSRLFVYALVCAALPVFRARDKSGAGAVGPASYRAPVGMVMAGIGIAASIVLAARMNVREAGSMAVLFSLATAHWYLNARKGK